MKVIPEYKVIVQHEVVQYIGVEQKIVQHKFV